MNEPPKFQLKRDYIVERLRTAIISGELQPGQKLRQEELATQFQISSTPVREALRKLEAEGLVTSVPHQGVYVTRLDPEEIEERYHLRALLEGYAAKEAVTSLHNEPTRCEKVLADLQQYQATMLIALKEKRYGDAERANSELHLRLYDEARSPLLKQMIIDLWQHSPPSNIWPFPHRVQQVERGHAELFDAIRNDNAALAEQVLREQLELLACQRFFDDWMRQAKVMLGAGAVSKKGGRKTHLRHTAEEVPVQNHL